MKRIILITFALCCAWLLVSVVTAAESDWPQSDHPYANDTDQTWSYQHPDAADWLRIQFSPETETEQPYDRITIIDTQGIASEYQGNELAGKTLYLPGNRFTIQLTSDSSVNKYGFSFTNLRGLTQAEYEEERNTVVGTCGENVTWTMNRRTGTLTISGSGAMTDYATQDGEDWVLTSPPYWDWDAESSDTEESRSQIRHIVVGSGITAIGGGAFRDLDGLEDIEIPSTVTRIGGWAFDRSTALQEITLPEGLTIIDDSTFSDCHSLTTVNIPQSVEAIGPWAFYNTAIVEIDIPAKVASIGERAFYECTALQNITVAGANPYLKSIGGVLFANDGKEMICYCPGRTDMSFQVPDGVQLIRPSAFSYSGALKTVTLPDSLLTIQNWAFGHTGLTEILLPPNVQRLEFNAFGMCESLTTATLPFSLKEIGEAAFTGCPLSVVNYEGSVAEWNDITVGDSNDTLLNAEFYYNANPYCTHVLAYRPAIPHTCTADGTIAYWECTICGNRFLDSQATQRAQDIAVPASHLYVNQGITTPPTCSEPGVKTFVCSECDAGTEGHIRTEAVPPTDAHHYINGYCVNVLRDGVTLCGRAKPTVLYSGNCGYNSSNIINLYLYPGQSLNYDRMYSDNVQWTLDSDGTLRVFGSGTMCSCIQISRANNYGTVLSTFYAQPWYDYRTMITHVVIDHGVTTVGSDCFLNCSNLVSAELPDTLTSIQSDAFSNTGSLHDIYYHGTSSEWDAVHKSGLDTTGKDICFLGVATIIPDLVLPSSLTAIGSEAFRNLNVQYIEVPVTVTEIASDAFDDDIALIVAADSYAEEWARAHVIRYIPK
ncbi:MAG: leucine-rich repeat protein [Blautia sp.]|nr:leucine-rich repeat protein [Blautia sp.]